jgi:hypothetical protein
MGIKGSCLFVFWDRILLYTCCPGTCYVARAVFKLATLLPLPPECWDYRHVSLCPTFNLSFLLLIYCGLPAPYHYSILPAMSFLMTSNAALFNTLDTSHSVSQVKVKWNDKFSGTVTHITNVGQHRHRTFSSLQNVLRDSITLRDKLKIFLFFFWDRVWLCSSGWPQIHDPSASAFQVLILQVCTTKLSW